MACEIGQCDPNFPQYKEFDSIVGTPNSVDNF